MFDHCRYLTHTAEAIFGVSNILGGAQRSLNMQDTKDADALYAFKSRGFGGETGIVALSV